MKDYLKERLRKYDVERDVNGRAGGDYGHNLADMILAEQEMESFEKEAVFEKFALLLEQTKNKGLYPDNVFEHLEEKGKLLQKIFGYTKLMGDKRTIQALIIFNDVIIGKAFQTNYKTAVEALK